ncbi:hypothetical protein CAPTEDRAFT_193537, partial [Capitella teleta]
MDMFHIIDHDNNTCTVVGIPNGETDTWWQGDIGTSLDVHAIRIHTTIDCGLRKAKISLSNRVKGFLEQDVSYCTKDVSLVLDDVYIQCMQPISGRFLTIEMSGQDSGSCLSLCELEVYLS